MQKKLQKEGQEQEAWREVRQQGAEHGRGTGFAVSTAPHSPAVLAGPQGQGTQQGSLC